MFNKHASNYLKVVFAMDKLLIHVYVSESSLIPPSTMP